MSEITDVPVKLPAAVEGFVMHWGNLGGQWGVNRSVAQIHALLYLSDKPLHAEVIAETLGIARSNVSNSLKELTGWNLIRRVPISGDRRDHFVAETDLWEMVTRIAAGRKEREIDPAIAALRVCAAQAEDDPAVGAVARRRLKAMLDFTQTMEGWYAQMLHVPHATLAKLIRLGSRIVRYLPVKPEA
ncbi:GbsR/MarR family transcriptional regulator [Methylobacterium haplocladii]|uniref:HTH-type transcriptional regulator n=1 Tax=Methylobacterium haplocladii TaxID=1176176 RepID=A0A512IV87_9HYPH|nr:MarR family transcriptional regulator [Methylobacterium haplocladii]GEP01613.1 transcriptional regulator [Methylobacterium haplocladii]GLS61273.1 transcriptional regulator [Methylobacterium haplocladii]